MKIEKKFAESNLCYKTNEKINVKGIMLYSTMYPQPDAEKVAMSYNSEESSAKKGKACVHAVIDACPDNEKKVYQILPWDCRGWHSGSNANGTHIAVEMCEPDCIKYKNGSQLECSDKEKAKEMIEKALNSAVELCAFLCLKFELDPLKDGVILSHKEGVERGIASGMNDLEHLFKFIDKNYKMDDFRKAVAAKIEERITTEYIAPRHYDRLKVHLNHVINSSQVDFNYIVSFRPAGKYSVNMLEAGAAAKPHDILAKTIKPEKITKEESEFKPLLLLYGFAATRDGNNNISGIYRADGTILERKNMSLKEFIIEATGIKENDLDKFNNMSEDQILSEILKINAPGKEGRYANKYIAGDYDIHDMIGKNTSIGPAPISDETGEESYVMNLLNKIMVGHTTEINKKTPFIKNAFYPIQHGPQYNYIAHMYNEEADKALDENVSNPLLPVMVLNVDKAGKSILWTEIEDIDELEAYYSKHSVNIKDSWGDFKEYILARQNKSLQEIMKNRGVNTQKGS